MSTTAHFTMFAVKSFAKLMLTLANALTLTSPLFAEVTGVEENLRNV